MSNIVTSLKKKQKRVSKKQQTEEFNRITKEQAMKQANNSTDNQVAQLINRPLPNTLYVNVKTGEMKLGDEETPMGQLPAGFVFDERNPNFEGLYEFLDGLDGDKITKVILDANEHFKIQSYTEFVDRLKQAEIEYRKRTELENEQSAEEFDEVVSAADEYLKSPDLNKES